MRLKPYQLSLWCDAATHGRRKWFWLSANVLLLLLSLLLKLFWPVLAVLLFVNALVGTYLLHRHHAFGKVYQRKPRPVDAQCETVLIDAALIGHGIRLRAVAQPFEAAPALSLRLGSGVLLLGAAMVLTADELPREERSALFSAMNGLNLKPSRLTIHNPVLCRERAADVTVVTVRDGMNNRRYFLGTPQQVCQRCSQIYDGSARDMTQEDRARIDETAAGIALENGRVLAWATALEEEAPIFLGMAALGDELHRPALQDAATLRGMGLTLMLDAGTQGADELAALRELMNLPEHHARADLHLTPHAVHTDVPLGITRHPGDSLVEPVTFLRARFSIIETALRRFAVVLGLPLFIALLSGSSVMALYLTGLLMAAVYFVGVDVTLPPLRWPTVILCSALALLTGLFMRTQAEGLRIMAGGFLSVTAAYCTMRRMCGGSFRFSRQLRNPALWLTLAGIIMLSGLLVTGLVQGLACLVPLGYAVLVSAVIAMLILLEQTILR